MGKQGIVEEDLRMRSLPASHISCLWWGNHWGNEALSAYLLQPRLKTMGNGLTALLIKFVQNTGKLHWGLEYWPSHIISSKDRKITMAHPYIDLFLYSSRWSKWRSTWRTGSFRGRCGRGSRSTSSTGIRASSSTRTKSSESCPRNLKKWVSKVFFYNFFLGSLEREREGPILNFLFFRSFRLINLLKDACVTWQMSPFPILSHFLT